MSGIHNAELSLSRMREVLRSLQSFVKREDAGVATFVSLALPVLLGLGGLSIDVGRWYTEKRSLQTAADAAAVGGAMELTEHRPENIETEALADAAINGAPLVTGTTITVNNPPSMGPNSADDKAVEVIITRQSSAMLSSLILDDDPTVVARAVAIAGNIGDYCVLGLQEVNVAVLVQGNAQIILNCGVASNANLFMDGNSAELTATSATITGEVTGFEGNLDVPPDATEENAELTQDPYDDLEVPSPLPSNGTVSGGSTVTYTPGRYTSDIEITGNNTTVVFEPGTYVLDDANLTISGGTVTGDGVTFIFTGSNSNNIGNFHLTGNGTIDFTAPDLGDYAGMVFFQDSAATGNAVNTVDGTSNIKISGALYSPGREIEFTGDMTNFGGGCTQVVALKVTFTGDSNLGFDCEGTGVRPIGAARVALVE